ncbi:MAG: HAMP domain-containing protein [Chloroflexi bacterium]|nr:HAMP domain-containing protein [Chloroflexota bacterium]
MRRPASSDLIEKPTLFMGRLGTARRTIAYKLLLVLILFSAVPATAILLFASQITAANMTSAAQTSVNERLRGLDQLMAAEERRLLATVRSLADNAVLAHWTALGDRRLVEAAVGPAQGEGSRSIVLNAQGQVLVGDLQIAAGSRVVQRALAGETDAGKIVTADGTVLLAAAAPLWDGSTLSGALLAVQPLDDVYLGRIKLVMGDEVLLAAVSLGDSIVATGAPPTGAAYRETVSALAPELAGGDHRYQGWTTILGHRLLGSTLPLMDGEQVVGMALVGVPEVRVLAQGQEMQQLAVAVGLVLLVLAALAGRWVARRMTAPVRQMVEVTRRITQGDLAVRAVATERDELGTLAAHLNQMLDSIIALVQTSEERDALQRQVRKLLDEVSAAGQGDLTVQAEVTADTLGAVADAFNYMVEELRRIVGDVDVTTRAVASSTDRILASTADLARGAEYQAGQAAAVARAVDDMAGSIRSVSDHAQDAAAVADQALADGRRGREAVRRTIEGMARIRQQAARAEIAVRRLDEGSRQIGEMARLIEDFAEQTNLLALNAAIQAAVAGEHGRGFAVVADEIRRLAERSARAAKQVATLVETVQTEIGEAVAAMTESNAEVAGGSALADQAGSTLDAIGAIAERLHTLIQAISQAAEQQARTAESISRAMADISVTTEQTSQGTREAATSVVTLAELAARLRSSVATFKLPASAA